MFGNSTIIYTITFNHSVLPVPQKKYQHTVLIVDHQNSVKYSFSFYDSAARVPHSNGPTPEQRHDFCFALV